jgi:hypothetical protein
VHKAGDRNVDGFTGAMDLEASLYVKMMKLVQPFGLLLVANDKKEIAILHHPHNFSGTASSGMALLPFPSCSTTKETFAPSRRSSLPSQTSSAAPPSTTSPPSPPPPANVDSDGVAANGGNAAKDDDGIPADGVQNGGCRRCGRRNNAANGDSDDVVAGGGDVATSGGGIAAVGNGTANLTALSCFIPAPFLCNAVLTADSPYPLALILAARAAREAHVHAHDREEEFDESNVDAHVKLFSLWCLGVHQGKIPRQGSCSPQSP